MLEEVPAPQRIAPFALALSAEAVVGDEEVANGRFVVLHDPAGPEAWEGTFRVVTFVRAVLEPEFGADPLLAKLRAQETDLNTQLAQARVQLGPAHPKIKELESQREEVRSDSRTEVAKISGRLKNDYLAASHREQLLRAALEDQKQQANKLNESAIEYSLLKRDAEAHTLTIHRLVQAVIRDGLEQQAQQQWAERSIRAVHAALPSYEHGSWPAWERIVSHAQD